MSGRICHQLAIAVAETPCCIPPATASHYSCHSQVMSVIRKYVQLKVGGQVGEADGTSCLNPFIRWLNWGAIVTVDLLPVTVGLCTILAFYSAVKFDCDLSCCIEI